MIRVVVVEDSGWQLASTVEELEVADDITIVGSARTAASSTSLLLSTRPDVALIDLVLPDGLGTSIIAELAPALPETAFVVLSAYEDYERIYAAILAGAVGYLSKLYAAGALCVAVRQTAAGESPMSGTIARKVLRAFHTVVKPNLEIGVLTAREQQVLHVLTSGRSYQEIADSMNVSIDTVRSHIRNIYKKLHVTSRSEIGKALRHHE